MEELTRKNGKGIWMREIEKLLRRFDASLKWLLERIQTREVEMERIRDDDQRDEREKDLLLRTMRTKSIADVLEEVDVLIDTHHYNEFSGTKSSMFLKKVIENRNVIDVRLLKKTWRTLNCSPKTMKIIREIQENLLCVGKRREMITKKKTETKCRCSTTGLQLNANHIISCCKSLW